MDHRWIGQGMLGTLLLLLAACGGDGGRSAEGSDLTGQVVIDGSSTVFPVAEAVAEEFQIENRGVRVSVGYSGTGGGCQRFCHGETDISNASRPIRESEIEACGDNGVEYTEIAVAWDGLSVVTNPGAEF
ncbi:MAG TPA: substrate-binding domain-containing protein, partial [Longimicrobiales bacterium]|nr:substrate-binding domain-containing protein [Longimicrobiales bacterium]